MLNEIIVTQPQAEIFALQFSRHQRVELQRRPETRTFLASELNLQIFQRTTMYLRQYELTYTAKCFHELQLLHFLQKSRLFTPWTASVNGSSERWDFFSSTEQFWQDDLPDGTVLKVMNRGSIETCILLLLLLLLLLLILLLLLLLIIQLT